MYWRHTLKSLVPHGLNVSESVWSHHICYKRWYMILNCWCMIYDFFGIRSHLRLDCTRAMNCDTIFLLSIRCLVSTYCYPYGLDFYLFLTLEFDIRCCICYHIYFILIFVIFVTSVTINLLSIYCVWDFVF